jgi:hypothetical protein
MREEKFVGEDANNDKGRQQWQKNGFVGTDANKPKWALAHTSYPDSKRFDHQNRHHNL